MNYIYASGAIGAKSTSLLKENEYLTLLKADKGEYLKVLRDLGYGFDHVAILLDEVITNELIKTKSELLTIVPDRNIIRLWFLKYDLINIKLLVKSHLFSKTSNSHFEKAGTINQNELREALINFDFDKVSDINIDLLKPISELVKKNNLSSQQLSFEIDNIVYSYILKEVEKVGDVALLDYLKRFIDMNNLITTFRAQNIELDQLTLNKSLVDGGSISKDIFKNIYQKREDEQKDILKLYFSNLVLKQLTNYYEDKDLSKLGQVIQEDILDKLTNYNYDTFTSGPLINYLVKKEFEITNVRRLYFDKDVEVSDLLKY